MARVLAAAAAVLVSTGLWFSPGTLEPRALAFVTLAAVAALAAALDVGRERLDSVREARLTDIVLWIGVAIGLAKQVLVLEGDRSAPVHHPWVSSLAWTALALSLVYLLPSPPRWVERARFPVLVTCFTLMVGLTFILYRLPVVDSWVIRQAGADALLQGLNPYEQLYPNIYGHARFYGPAFLDDAGNVAVYPYPPLVVLADLPAYLLFHNVRWTLLVAAVIGAFILVRVGRREPEEGQQGQHARSTAELAALLALFQTRTLYVAGVSWTEPLVFAGWAAALVATRRLLVGGPREGLSLVAVAVGAALGLFLATKQYTPLLALPLVVVVVRARPPGWQKAAASAAVVLGVLVVPFLLWSPGELWRDLLVAQLEQPFRADALSWLAAWASFQGGEPPAIIGFVLAALVVGAGFLVRRTAPHATAGAAITAAAAFLFFVLFNKQAFCNYYWLIVALLASASAVPRDDEAKPSTG